MEKLVQRSYLAEPGKVYLQPLQNTPPVTTTESIS